MSQPDPTPQKHHPLNATPNLTPQKTADLTKRCTCAGFQASKIQHPKGTVFATNLTITLHQKTSPRAVPQGENVRFDANLSDTVTPG